ncbi:PKD domain-containing protein [Hymenobacter sp. RP-2-7]|uniref:PKD domain-containing protein n=1 Tax=Hymenobacter polaris TaxID=2682546 RepID=A0A7Y0AAZ3_9BACT|nr:PKD domain-containing protein [Hymenobacter polaris]NML63872.1 PKD domain-containing protein [Hymenobacter polaris]
MKTYWTKAAWGMLASTLLLTDCKKNDNGQLDGPLPSPTFTYATKQDGFNSIVTFTNTTAYSGPGIVQYEWDFGDGTRINSSSATVTHTYTGGGTKQAQLLASARGGNGFSAVQTITLPDASVIVKQLLTGTSSATATGSKTWKLDNTTTDPITVGPSDSDPRSYYPGGMTVQPGSLPACQADDEYTFSNANAFTYDAKGQTFVAGGTGCDAPRSGTGTYTFGSTSSGLAQFVLSTPNSGGFKSFIGVTDAPDQIYRIVSISATNMVLKAGSATGNLVFQMKLIAK